jgi:hypothetical protein
VYVLTQYGLTKRVKFLFISLEIKKCCWHVFTPHVILRSIFDTILFSLALSPMLPIHLSEPRSHFLIKFSRSDASRLIHLEILSKNTFVHVKSGSATPDKGIQKSRYSKDAFSAAGRHFVPCYHLLKRQGVSYFSNGIPLANTDQSRLDLSWPQNIHHYECLEATSIWQHEEPFFFWLEGGELAATVVIDDCATKSTNKGLRYLFKHWGIRLKIPSCSSTE